jgi:TnpA family transposase
LTFNSFPTDFLGKRPDKHLYCTDHGDQPVLVPNRYEFQVYRQLRDRLEAGDIYCRDSTRFRSFEDDLIDTTTWRNQKTALIKRARLPILEQPIEEHLACLEKELETLISDVNQRVSSGENTHIKMGNKRSKTAWQLPYQVNDEGINHFIYNGLSQIDIVQVLGFANQQCGFTTAFEHVLDRNVTSDLDTRTLFAALIAWGTNAGIGPMAQRSDVNYNTLLSVSENFIRLETLKIANNLVSDQIAQLPIFDVYKINNEIHSSSDGQKFETNLATINARHSPKYFGLKKGVVAYTLVADHVPVNARIIGANEHESHYVFDLLHNNSSEIQPTTHSTDTHGTNEVNFAIMHMFGYQFAPRYKDIAGTVARSLYGFNHPSHYDGFLKPIRKLKQSLIFSEWVWIQRIMVSLALKNTTQSVITSKLSSYARQNKTKLALWEYDNIHKSLYLLRYVDEFPLRKNVQLALNRGESYHKLRKAVAFASFGKLRFKNEPDQQVWQECSRLITNCIILYNSVILSRLLEHRQNLGDDEAVKQLKKVSPVAWQHINMHGRYEFTKNTDQFEIDDIIQELIKNEAVVKSPK